MSSSIKVFNRESSFFLCWLIALLLFLPKINLVSMGGEETAGLRIDDFLLLGFATLYMWGSFALQRRPLKVEWLMLSTLIFGIFSYFLNRLFIFLGIIDVNASLFYALRPLEYFLFFYVGYHSFTQISLDNLIKNLFVWNAAIMLMQKAGLIGAFTNYGYWPTVQDRVTGISAFPSETGAFLNILFCYLLFGAKPPQKLKKFFGSYGRFADDTYPYWLCLFTAYLVILTGSRAALGTHFLIFLAKVIYDLRKGTLENKIYAAFFLSLGAFIGIIGILNTDSLYQRSQGLFSWQNVELAKEVWQEIEIHQNPMGNEAVALTSEYDTSWWLRIHKWCYALKIYWVNPESYLFGIGPGFAFAGLDGGFLRIFVELGLLGFICYMAFFWELAKASSIIRTLLFALFINMIFFDAYLSYKVMALFFFIAGSEFAKNDTHKPHRYNDYNRI